MTQMFPVPVFSCWRPIWNQDDTTKTLADVADSLARRRNQIVAGSGEVRGFRSLAPRLREFRLLRKEQAEKLRQKDPALLHHSYVSGIADFHPFIEAARWSRWLLLEQALADAMQYGDLLFGALVLRTQIEDIGALLRLQEIERQLQAKSPLVSDVVDEVAAIEEIVDFLWERFLPRFERATSEEMGAGKPNGPSIHRPDTLKESFWALNDYVHPNYGSHIATIFPETSVSGRVLLTAFNTVYDVFLKLDFVQQCPVRQFHMTPKPPVSYVRVLRRFVERTLPRLDQIVRKERGYRENWASQPLSIFKDSLRRETDPNGFTADGFLQLANDPECQGSLEEKASTLRSLCSAIEPNNEWSKEEVLHFVEKHTAPTVAPNTATWIMFANLRELGIRLETDANQLPTDVLFPRQPPFDQWISFTRDAIQLAILATHHKMELMRFAAVRMVNQTNPIGAILCARALLEHYAVANELAKRFKSGLESIEQTARSSRDVVPQFDVLERDIGRFLIGTKATSELERRWKDRWNRLGIAKNINVARDVEHALPNSDWRGFLYAYFSRCAHGDLLTGADLLRPGSELSVAVNLAKVVMVLADSESIEWTLDYWSPVTAAMLRLTRPGCVSDAARVDELRQALRKGTTFGQHLKPGRDVLGQGTEADPYRFREEFQYHQTFYQFCSEGGIDLNLWKRISWFFDGKPGDCLAGPDGQRIYFQAAGEPCKKIVKGSFKLENSMEEKCCRCGAVLFKKDLIDDKGHTGWVGTPPNIEAEGAENFIRCSNCKAKNIVVHVPSSHGLDQLIILRAKD
jgi:hypothetical protein